MNTSVTARLSALNWTEMAAHLAQHGHARGGVILTPDECANLICLYDKDATFRSTIEMSRYRFGEGQYRYFDVPLPDVVAELRQALYRHLAPIANDMAEKLPGDTQYPPTLSDYLEICHAAGQHKPTPLLLRYGPGGYNRLHQDLYGEVHFPLQAMFMLNRPNDDFTGGEFLLLENQPRAQSIGHVIMPQLGEMVIFPVRERPVQGKRGFFRAPMRHGVSRLLNGRRHTLGVIFHDAE